MSAPATSATPPGALSRGLGTAGRSARAGLARLLASRKALFGAVVVVVLLMIGLLAPVIAPGSPLAVTGPQNLPPSAHHLLGTTGQGNDVFAQVVWGTRNSLAVGLVTGFAIAFLGVALGLSAAYFGGWADNLLTLLMNIFLVIPGLPLLVVMAAFLAHIHVLVGRRFGDEVLVLCRREVGQLLQERDYAPNGVVVVS